MAQVLKEGAQSQVSSTANDINSLIESLPPGESYKINLAIELLVTEIKNPTPFYLHGEQLKQAWNALSAFLKAQSNPTFFEQFAPLEQVFAPEPTTRKLLTPLNEHEELKLSTDDSRKQSPVV